MDTSLHYKFPHGLPISTKEVIQQPPSNILEKFDNTPDDKPSTDQPVPQKPGSFLKKKWAEGKRFNIIEIKRWRKNETF